MVLTFSCGRSFINQKLIINVIIINNNNNDNKPPTCIIKISCLENTTQGKRTPETVTPKNAQTSKHL